MQFGFLWHIVDFISEELSSAACCYCRNSLECTDLLRVRFSPFKFFVCNWWKLYAMKKAQNCRWAARVLVNSKVACDHGKQVQEMAIFAYLCNVLIHTHQLLRVWMSIWMYVRAWDDYLIQNSKPIRIVVSPITICDIYHIHTTCMHLLQ